MWILNENFKNLFYVLSQKINGVNHLMKGWAAAVTASFGAVAANAFAQWVKI